MSDYRTGKAPGARTPAGEREPMSTDKAGSDPDVIDPVDTDAAQAGADESATVTPQVEAADAVDADGDDEGVKKTAKEEFVEIGKTIFYALLIALVLRILLFQPFTIPSASMEPNLYEGDYIIVSKWDYGYSRHSIPLSPPVIDGRIFGGEPKRGDVVVFKLPRDNRTDYIKRVIGLPGDSVQMRDGKLLINGQPVQDQPRGVIDIDTGFGFQRQAMTSTETLPGGRSFVIQDMGPDGPLDSTGVYTVPEGHYFMMGDNRDNSIDSRVPMEGNGVGLVPAENLVGKANLVLLSWKPGASLWKPWTWFTHLRPSRFFTVLK